MTQRKCKMISIYQKDQERLDQLTDALGMKESEIIRYALEKLEEDKTMQQIILQKFLKEERDKISRERLLRIMSVIKTLKKDAPGLGVREGSSVSIGIDLSDFNKWGGLEQAERIARLKWMEDI